MVEDWEHTVRGPKLRHIVLKIACLHICMKSVLLDFASNFSSNSNQTSWASSCEAIALLISFRCSVQCSLFTYCLWACCVKRNDCSLRRLSSFIYCCHHGIFVATDMDDKPTFSLKWTCNENVFHQKAGNPLRAWMNSFFFTFSISIETSLFWKGSKWTFQYTFCTFNNDFESTTVMHQASYLICSSTPSFKIIAMGYLTALHVQLIHHSKRQSFD